MKILFGLLLTYNAYAMVFDCDDRGTVEKLILENNSVTVMDVTMINMMKIDWKLPYRSYARIGDPWFNIDVDMDMMKGNEGYAILEAHTLPQGERVVNKYYQCTPVK
jgi:hypothetical protein